MSRSNLLINEPPLTVSPTLATILGLEEAIVIQQLHYWLGNIKNAGRVENGEKWVYNTYEEWQEGNFPFWSVDKIQRLFLKLEKQGVVISAQLDAKSRDMKKFYRINYEAVCAMHDSILRPSIDAKLHDVNGTETTTENNNKLDLVDLELSKLPALSIRSAVSEYFKINVNWDTKTSRQWLEWAHGENITAEQIARAAETWRADKQFNWTHPTLKGIFEKWQMLMDAKVSPLETQSTPLEDWRNEIKL